MSRAVFAPTNYALYLYLYPDIFYREFGMKHIFVRIEGPDGDLGPLRELLQWRKTLGWLRVKPPLRPSA